MVFILGVKHMRKGGRGKRAPYVCITVRVPVPVREQVFELLSRYHQYLQSPDADATNPPNFIATDKPMTGIVDEPIHNAVTVKTHTTQEIEEVTVPQLAIKLNETVRNTRKITNKPLDKFKADCLKAGIELLEIKILGRNKRGENKSFLITNKN